MVAALGLTANVRDYFLARPHEWVSVHTLMRLGGECGWRTRVSEVRRFYGLTIENRVRTYQDDGETIRVSEYRYLPREASDDLVADGAAVAPVGVLAVGASVAPVSGAGAAVPAVRAPGVAVPLGAD